MNAYERSLKRLNHREELVKLRVMMRRGIDKGDAVVERDYLLDKIDQVLGGSPIQLDPECQALFNQRISR